MKMPRALVPAAVFFAAAAGCGSHPRGPSVPPAEAAFPLGCAVPPVGDAVEAPEMAAEPICFPGGWCWEASQPFGTSEAAIWGSGRDDAWLGAKDALAHWDGSRWSSHTGELQPGEAVVQVSGTASDDVWLQAADALLLCGNAASDLRAVKYWEWAAGLVRKAAAAP